MTAPPGADRRRLGRYLLGEAGRVFALLLCAVIAAARPNFLNPDNLTNFLRQASLMVILASGLTLVIVTGGIDLSVGAVLALAATSSGYLWVNHYPPAVAIGVPLLLGAAAGLLNGLLTAVVGLPSFISTYEMRWIAQGMANLVMQGEIFFDFPKPFLFLGAGHVLGIPVPVLVMAALVAVATFVQNHTVFGRELYALGSNPTAALLAGLPTRRILLIVHTASGITAGVAGLVMIARLNAAEASVGEPLLLPALGAVVIGGTSLAGGRGGVGGTVIGSLITTVIINGMNLLGIPSELQPLVVGAAIIISVVLDQLSRLGSGFEPPALPALEGESISAPGVNAVATVEKRGNSIRTD